MTRRALPVVDGPLEVTLDGEIAGTLPGTFGVAGDALRVIVPPGFTDIDDDIPGKGNKMTEGRPAPAGMGNRMAAAWPPG